jgi:hypothetical protein
MLPINRKEASQMTRNLKALGLVLAAVFAFSAVAVSAASAAEFHSEVEPTVITAHSETNQVFTVSGQSVICETAEFSGTVAKKTTTEITVHPKFTKCTFQGEPATVTTKGCNFIFKSNLVGAHAPVTVECKEAAHPHIIISSAPCTMYIGEQNPGQGVTYTNINAKKEVTVNATVTGIKITKKEGPLCFLLGNEGAYTGKAIVKGFEDKGTVSGSTTEGFVFSEGAQKNVWWE